MPQLPTAGPEVPLAVRGYRQELLQVRQEEGGSAALAPVGAGVGVRLLTCCWEKWEGRFCTSRHFLNRLGAWGLYLCGGQSGGGWEPG